MVRLAHPVQITCACGPCFSHLRESKCTYSTAGKATLKSFITVAAAQIWDLIG